MDASGLEAGIPYSAWRASRPERQIFIFVLWEASRFKEEEIIADLQQHFTVLKQYEVAWPQANWVSHLEAFYGHSSQVWISKARRNGTGNFRVVIVEDAQAVYGKRDNMRGMQEMVNTNIYDAKKRYRKLIKSKDWVHSSVNLEETRHNLAMLLDRSLDDFLAHATLDGKVEYLFTSPPRDKGWKSLQHLFTIMNESVPYVVMRNYASLLDEKTSDAHDDIDLLVSNRDLFVAVTGAVKTSSKPDRAKYLLLVGEQVHIFDLREVGDGYYDPALASDMIERRQVIAGYLCVPSQEDLFYTLLYHALIHKTSIAPDYATFFAKNASGMGLPDYAERIQKEGDAYLKELLSSWLVRHNYAYCKPLGAKVGFNEANIAATPRVKSLPRSKAHLWQAELGLNRLKLHLLTGIDLPNIFRIQIRLGGLFKIDLCLGDIKEIGI